MSQAPTSDASARAAAENRRQSVRPGITTRLAVRLILAAGAAMILVRLRYPRLTWMVTTTPRDRRALMSELQRLESDPLFAADWRMELEQRAFDAAFAELVRALTHGTSGR